MKRVRTVVVGSIASVVVVAGLGVPVAQAQQDTSVYIAAVGDIACDPSPKGQVGYAPAYNNGEGTKDGCRQKAVAQAIMAANPDQFWALGDNQYYDATYAKYMEVYDKAFGSLKSITRPIPGNHEWKDLTIPTKPGNGYFTYFGAAAHPESNGTYSFDIGDWHVLAINDNVCDSSRPCGPGSELATWIATDMAANTKPCTAAMVHHPLWSLGEAHKGGYVPLVPVWNQLHDLGVDFVLTGHDHNYLRTKPLGKATVDPTNPAKVAIPATDPNGMVQFVLGTGGVDAYAASATTAQELESILAGYVVGKPSPGLFGAGGFRLSADRYTFSYLPAAGSHPFTDSGGRTCRRATNGKPQEVPADPPPTSTPLADQKVLWSPSNTSAKAASSTGGTLTPDAKATTSGDGAIAYSVTSPGSAGCSVDPSKGVITYAREGQCEVTATAAATATYAQARRSVVFTFGSSAVQKVTWAPSNRSVKAASPTGGTITPNAKASSNGDGDITYEVTDGGQTGCTVDSRSGVITYTGEGQCEVTATAASTDAYDEGRRSVVFTITSGGPYKKQVMTAVQPAWGPLAGGNTIVLVGQGFFDATKVTMDGTSATFQVISDTRLSVVVPPGKKDGPVNIRVTVGPPSGAIVAPDGYTYREGPEAQGTTAPVDAAVPGAATVAASLGNPEKARAVARGLRLLSRAEAATVRATVVSGAPGATAATGPTVRVKARRTFALAVTGQATGQVIDVRVSVRGRSVPLGSVQVDAKGVLTLPALWSSRAGLLTFAMTAPQSGTTTYVKVRVAA